MIERPFPFDGSDAGLSAAERAFRHVWRAISQGAIAPGELVTEEGLAAGLSISRTPLRDAVQRLEALGLLVREPARGLRVPPLDLDEMAQLSATREVLEGLLAAQAARRVAAGEADAAPLRAAHDRLARVMRIADADLTLAAGLDFHEALRRLADNRAAAACHQQVLLAFERYRHLARGAAERPEHVLAEHAAVVAAIEAGDAAAAERAMRRHIAAGRDIYASVLSKTLPRTGRPSPKTHGPIGFRRDPYETS
ncbi:GntR family transcriptional regulator [Roseomonas hellenica]|uniref:GntR family transcriptional regulator n=1 Tax=Plastoroseomonas hellenica TaxID=2687306 RepID=A0ABS5F2W2_9PROT|nr:GntR family transcriptional regulator [Plastoroseomonas hellenica]MBR0666877.1 GntR family transcriptional regulator [Plastoroseomonas hellenica]